MFTVITKITFTQQTNKNFKDSTTGQPAVRNKTIIYDLSHNYKVKSSWQTLTDSGEITLPKNVLFRDQYGTIYPATSSSQGSIGFNIGGFSSLPPMFMRGDKVQIDWGYAYYKGTDKTETIYTQTIFTGYISEVTSKKPFVLKIEDNMFILKQIQARGGNNNFFAGSKYTVESMLAEMISNARDPYSNEPLPFTVNNLTKSSVGDWIAQGTIAEVLDELHRKGGLHPYFKGNELRCGTWVYYPGDSGNLTPGKVPTFWKFDFQQNIISDDLQYKRKDDLVLSAVCISITETATGKITKDGQAKTKKTRNEVLLRYQNGAFATPFIVTSENPLPENELGERHTFIYLDATVADLIKKGTAQLMKYCYTGFRGKFKTFGMPFIQLGNYIELVDSVLPERNGTYIVKGVEYEGGVEGLRQEIELECLLPSTKISNIFSNPSLTPDQLNTIISS